MQTAHLLFLGASLCLEPSSWSSFSIWSLMSFAPSPSPRPYRYPGQS